MATDDDGDEFAAYGAGEIAHLWMQDHQARRAAVAAWAMAKAITEAVWAAVSLFAVALICGAGFTVGMVYAVAALRWATGAGE